jgi:cell wall-associated NlpC family hydrolase
MNRTLPVAAGVALALAGLAGEASAAPYASRTLEQGSRGSDVRTLQRFLDRAGQETVPDGAFGPATADSVRAFERAEGRAVDGRATRAEQRLVRRVAAAEQPAGPERATVGPDGLAVPPASAPPEVAAIIEAGNAIARKPYKYGGGHGRWRDSGYDCSGSISYALHGAGLLDLALDSSAFARWGERGRGEWVTIRTNPGHAYMIVAGIRFDTSARRGGRSRWTERMRSPRGYVARHPEGL